jgi:hypothetical protein
MSLTDDLPDLDALFAGGIQHDVTECPRCEGDHPALTFRPYTIPCDATHWAMCPTTSEPVQMDLVLS